MQFATCQPLPMDHVIAPDGSEVRVLVGLAGGGLAHFRLYPRAVSVAVHHRSVEEIWYVVSGRGQMWRKNEEDEEIVDLEPGVSLTIPLKTHFQFRAVGPDPLDVIGVTMPPWPGDNEAIRSQGPWTATVEAGPGLAAPDPPRS
ncbi:MAG: cupin domain-containing protein [Acidimicrobiaceae bacterium]|nr:cupin domain-containing protein [Acidimicrobiaceae bacterium]